METSSDSSLALHPPIEQTSTSLIQRPPQRDRLTQGLSWGALGLFFLVFFTWIKLPEDQIKNYIFGLLNQQLAQAGMHLKAEETQLSFFGGITYSLKNVEIGSPLPLKDAHIDLIQVSPSLLGLLTAKISGQIWITYKSGTAWADVGIRGSQTFAQLKFSKFELGKLGVLPKLTGLQALGFAPDAFDIGVTGEAQFSGRLEEPKTLSGTANLTLNHVNSDPQSLFGFSIPRIKISQIKTKLVADGGKLIVQLLQFGDGNSTPTPTGDDLHGSLTGEITLGNTWESSLLNLKTRFAVSESIKTSVVLLDALLGAGKTPDDSYAFTLTGPISGMNAQPDKL